MRAELAEIGVAPEFSNRCMTPLQNIRKRVLKENDTGQIEALIGQARDAERDAHDLIEAAVEAAKRTPAATGMEDPPGPAPAPPTTVKKPENFKRKKQVYAAKVKTKPYLETPEDVDEYLAALRREIEDALDENTRVEIL